MAVYVYIEKESEGDDEWIYTFSPDDGVVGRMGIRISTGDMRLIDPCPNDHTNTWYQCACKAIWEAWAVKKLPLSTQYIYQA